MKKHWILGMSIVVMLAVTLVIVSGPGAFAGVREASETESAQALAATLVVTSTADSGPGTLRQALLDAGNGDAITFDVAVFPLNNPMTITLTSGPLPGITQGDLTIDGSGAGVILDGGALLPGCIYITSDDNLIEGLQIYDCGTVGIGIEAGAKRNTVADNVIGGCGYAGVWIFGTDTMSNTIIGNLIGTDASGSVAVGNLTGVHIQGGQYNRIGGDTPAERNVISGNAPGTGNGIQLSGDHNTVSGNYIGTDPSGTRAVPNSMGVGVDGSYNIIGGDAPGAGNLISGNEPGVWIGTANSQYNVVSGNYIGTDASGSVAIPNSHSGVFISDGAQHNVVGGTTPSERNVISGNAVSGGSGIWISDADYNVIIGNYVGTDATGTAPLGNAAGLHTGSGVGISDGAQYNTVGGDTAEERNVISGNNGPGIQILFDAHHNTISGNFIGTDESGAVALPNISVGVQVGHASSNNVIGGVNGSPGGSCSGECNLISGNGGGISLADTGTSSNVVSGNYIGTDVTGKSAIPNDDIGVYILLGAGLNVIGGETSAERNLISGNDRDGVSIGDGGSNGNIVVGNYIGTEVSGNGVLGNTGEGVRIWGGAQGNSVVDNVISNSAHNGVSVWGSETMSNTVVGNLIGTNASGSAALRNGSSGVRIHEGAKYNIIGGDEPKERNVISGNQGGGVDINNSSFNMVSGNYIGVDINGVAAISNNDVGVGVCCGGKYNTIGGDTSGERNVICGNAGPGVSIMSSGTDHNVVSGNSIGIGIDGETSVPNGMGIFIWYGADYNTVGMSNTIAFNTGNGVEVDGSDTLSNTITRNSIYENAGMGISLSNGGNTELPAPTIMAYDLGAGTVSGSACGNCTIEIFSDGDDEGALYEGETTTDGAGSFAFSKGAPLTGPNVTATATDAGWNTSEFSIVERHVYLPLVLNQHEPPPRFPVFIGDTIAPRPISHQGELFYVSTVQIPARLTPGARYYFSSQRDAVVEAMVDDRLAVLLDSVEVFAYDYSAASGRPEPAIVEVPWTIMEQMVGETVTVEYRDVRAHIVSASPVWLIEVLATNSHSR